MMNAFNGKNVLVMGLGLHGGGLECIRYLLRHGAVVTCTDLRDRDALEPSLKALGTSNVRFVLGEHRREDFDKASIIVKNPAVPHDSPWLKGRENVETDLSLFLRAAAESPIIAVTGSKGKSTVVSVLHHILQRRYPESRLGGNIAVSPLCFVDDLTAGDPVVLELSSWQLHDLRGRGLLRPRIACITNLMWDHQNRYARFSDYEADKKVIYEDLRPGGLAVFPDDSSGRSWAAEFPPGQVHLVSGGEKKDLESAGSEFCLDAEGQGWFLGSDNAELLVPADLAVPGRAFRCNVLFAAAIARLWGCPAKEIALDAGSFPGIPYRMELFLECQGVRYYNDSAATIPEAAAAAVNAMKGPCVLIAGGTDKELDFAPLAAVADRPDLIVLLEGSATKRLHPVLEEAGARTAGPFGTMEQVVRTAVGAARPGGCVILSPGAASFEMFAHEFERGDAFKAACRTVTAS